MILLLILCHSRNKKARNRDKKKNAENNDTQLLLGFIREDKVPLPSQSSSNMRSLAANKGKRDGYSNLARKQSNSNYRFDKERFVQASMKFVVKNEGEDDYMMNLLNSNQTISWRNVI